MKSSPPYTIGEVAEHFGLATHVLRHWEDMGLLEPAERVNGRRRYDAANHARITMILRGKQIGLSLAQIGEMVSTPHSAHRAILKRHREDLDAQIARIEAARELIDHALSCDHEDPSQCLSFQALARSQDLRLV